MMYNDIYIYTKNNTHSSLISRHQCFYTAYYIYIMTRGTYMCIVYNVRCSTGKKQIAERNKYYTVQYHKISENRSKIVTKS